MHPDRIAHLVEFFFVDLVEALVLLLGLRLYFWLRHLVCGVLDCFISRCLFSDLLLGGARFSLRLFSLTHVVCIVRRLFFLTLSLLPLFTPNISTKTAHSLDGLSFLNCFKVFQAIGFVIVVNY